MSTSTTPSAAAEYNVIDPAAHEFHRCRNADEFRTRFEEATGCSIEHVTDQVIATSEPRAVFLVGSLPLGMGTSASDIDFIVMVNDRAAILNEGSLRANTDQVLEFSSDNDPLLAGMFATLNRGVLVDLHVAITPAIHAVQARLRRRGPELNETEIRTLGRLASGWLLWQTDGYLESNSLKLNDPGLTVYCCTKSFVSALIQWRKASRSLPQDVPLALQLGRSSVEMAYLAYFASEGLTFLGSKWLAQLGSAYGAAERLARAPLLREGVSLLFPSVDSTPAQAAQYLESVREFHRSMQRLIEEKMLFKIAFRACPQIESAGS